MVDLRNFNLSGTLGALSLIFRPSQCLPQAVVRNFNELPLPLSKAFSQDEKRFGTVNIRAVVLDKDDCFARPGETEIANEFKVCNAFIVPIISRLCQYKKGLLRMRVPGRWCATAKDYFLVHFIS